MTRDMPVHELVASVQAVFETSGGIPEPEAGGRADAGVADLPAGLQPTSRHSVPEWVRPGEGEAMPADGILVLEGESPATLDKLPESIDVLAYYLPYHFYPAGKWGIYLRASGVLSIASMHAAAGGRHCSADDVSLAGAILLQHERFHFFAELACSRAEVLCGWAPLYRHYFHDCGAVSMEEALSNAHALRVTFRRHPAAARKAVENWMSLQGPGYRDFSRCRTPAAFSSWCRAATFRILKGGQTQSLVGPGLTLSPHAVTVCGRTVTCQGKQVPHPTEFLFDGLSRATAPLYLVGDEPRIHVLKPFRKYAGIRVLVHTNDHPPPHVHVQVPPGRDRTRLEWPTLAPLPGERPLSTAERRTLDRYLSKYGQRIDEKIRRTEPRSRGQV